jgi:hypothetical protein
VSQKGVVEFPGLGVIAQLIVAESKIIQALAPSFGGSFIDI